MASEFGKQKSPKAPSKEQAFMESSTLNMSKQPDSEFIKKTTLEDLFKSKHKKANSASLKFRHRKFNTLNKSKEGSNGKSKFFKDTSQIITDFKAKDSVLEKEVIEEIPEPETPVYGKRPVQKETPAKNLFSF